MISIQNLSVEFSARPLFDNINYVINKRDKIALVGKNGAGKSTMLKIIAGLQGPSSGQVAVPEGITIGYLPQQMEVSDTLSVVDEVRKAFGHIDALQRELDEVNEQIAATTDFDSEKYTDLIDRMTTLSERLAMEQSDNAEAEIEKTLKGLGFVRSDFMRPTSEFSGGWRMRIELAKILLQRPDVLLLDEPTNHLDIESIQWLEQFLVQKANMVVLVSHDRAFIDNVTNRTIEISLGKIYDYSVNYSKYVVLRQERLEQQMRAYQNQQKQIKDTEEFIERFRYKATKAVQVQSRMKQLSKIERIEVDEVDTSHLNLKFPPAPRSGDYPIIADNVGKRYGEHQVFDNATFTIKRGEKVAVGDIRTKIRDILGAFMFGGEASEKKVKVLSGGEKTRLAMIRLLLEPVNLLILDEPTNHLDMKTKDILKQAIKDFDGTVIVVSHDREFLDGLVEKVYEFGGGKVRECLGGIYEFLDKKKMESLQELESPTLLRQQEKKTEQKSSASANQATSNQPTQAPRRISYAEQREKQKQLKRLQKKVEDAEGEIARIEGEIAEIEQKLAEGDTNPELYTLHAQRTKQLENAMSVWELASMEVEEFNTES